MDRDKRKYTNKYTKNTKKMERKMEMEEIQKKKNLNKQKIN